MSYKNGENHRKRPRLEVNPPDNEADEFPDEDFTAEEFDICLSQAILETQHDNTFKKPAQPNFSLEGEVQLLRQKVASLSRELHGVRLAKQDEIKRQTDAYKKQIRELQTQLEFKEHEVKAIKATAVIQISKQNSPKECELSNSVDQPSRSVREYTVDPGYWDSPQFCIRPNTNHSPTYFDVICKYVEVRYNKEEVSNLDAVKIALQSLTSAIEAHLNCKAGILQTVREDDYTRNYFFRTITETLSGTPDKSGVVLEALHLVEALSATYDETVTLVMERLDRDSLLHLVDGTFGERVAEKGMLLLSAGIESSCGPPLHPTDNRPCLWQAVAEYICTSGAVQTLCAATVLAQRGSETVDTCDCFHRLVENAMSNFRRRLAQVGGAQVVVPLNCLCSIAQSMPQYQLTVCRLVALCRDIPEHEEAIRDITKVWDFAMDDREVYIGCGTQPR